MSIPPASPEIALEELIERGLVRLRAASPQAAALLEDAAFAGRVARVVVASDFALETLRRQPALLAALAHDDGAAGSVAPALTEGRSEQWPEQRGLRAADSTRLWATVLADDVDAIPPAAPLGGTCCKSPGGPEVGSSSAIAWSSGQGRSSACWGSDWQAWRRRSQLLSGHRPGSPIRRAGIRWRPRAGRRGLFRPRVTLAGLAADRGRLLPSRRPAARRSAMPGGWRFPRGWPVLPAEVVLERYAG